MSKYQFINENGDFILDNPEQYSYLYFPTANESGIMSSITPELGGDCKTSQNTFLLFPVSSENLHNDKSTRNIWCKINKTTLWSASGRSSWQQAWKFTKEKEETKLEAGFMQHTITRKSKKHGISSKIESFVPVEGSVELMKVSFQNISEEAMEIQPIVAIPLYARSADNIRDHRHVTSLLHRIRTLDNGIVVEPTLTFDERGHQRNELVYGVFAECMEEKPIGFYPIVEDYIKEGGSFENPGALWNMEHMETANKEFAGYEAMGGMVFQEFTLEPQEQKHIIVVLGVAKGQTHLQEVVEQYIQQDQFDKAWKDTKKYWNQKVNVNYYTANRDFNLWMRWVSFQPMLRRIYGCSFLPHHDYGKGGRGWRDLWQDCLALLMMEPEQVRQMLIQNYAGVRMDGTNATIIGNKQGEFIADRNHITRVWMDHGVWPFLTTDLYIQQTGDLQILLEENYYFKDAQIHRGQSRDVSWDESDGSWMKDEKGEAYCGSLLEHLLIQHLTAFYDVGEHNQIRMRGADWNDALDLASSRGESVAFTNMYGKNLERIAQLIEAISHSGTNVIELEESIMLLVQREQGVFEDVKKKQAILSEYCMKNSHTVSGNKIQVSPLDLAKQVKEMGTWLKEHIRKTEWITDVNGNGWYNGYYDNSGNRVEGKKNGNIRMMLTSQVFSIMAETASQEQVEAIIHSVDQYLFDREVGGYRLNTDFHEVKMDLGRMFGFAYGHKENGAVFSHMAVMYANALYSRGEAKAGYKVIDTLFTHCSDFEKSKIYPGVPEYIDRKGRGMYHYLTGAASWLLVTVITEMFGIKGVMGSLFFEPKLLKEQFDQNGEISIQMQFAGKQFYITYWNKRAKEYGEYKVSEIKLNNSSHPFYPESPYIDREQIHNLDSNILHFVKIELE